MLHPTFIRAIFLAAALSFAGAALCDEAKLDNYGDPLPPGAVERLGTIRLQAKGGFAWMPDGKSLVTASGGRIWFWNVADGRPLRSLPMPGDTDSHYSIGVSR